jgi:ubiquinone/menaquinone biosynthesis C-methylase UbiE/uncharacterized protein YbaR (Trm112 family)
MLLSEAIEQILACPVCKGALVLENAGGQIACLYCQSSFPVQNDIPIFIDPANIIQKSERLFRDNLAVKHIDFGKCDLLAIAGKHHCIPVMKFYADCFRSRLAPHEWLLDVGIGYGWHWSKSSVSRGSVIGVDISLGNLQLAQKVLDAENNVLLVCADASRLPIRDNVISAIWSVQTIQHFPDTVFDRFLVEMNRILKQDFRIEYHNLHPSALSRGIYGLFRKNFHRSGSTGTMELQRLSESEWLNKWKSFHQRKVKTKVRYSELFFHPDFHIKPDPYPVWVERFMAEHLPAAASFIARQNVLCIESSFNS